jgi:phosphatidylinositol-3,4,5-trisphosphate 3-phosphatase/dual-specificity protein phosphatase PTEN
MGFPSEKVEGIYRNPMKEVLRFLDAKHKDRYRVYNLCSERGYDAQKFYNRVGVYPFDDHNAPPFDLILSFCRDVEAWLKEHDENIAVIHCKAGKGRTGLMICAWLVYNKDWKNADDAMKYYALARTNNQKGVTIPSQIRYIRYFHESLESLGWENPTFEPKLILLNRIIFHTLPKTGNISDLNFTIDVGKTTVFNYKDHVEKLKLKDEPKVVRIDKKKKGKGKGKEEGGEEGEGEAEELATFEVGSLPVRGDVRVDFESKGARIFQFWFNTYFVKPIPQPLNASSGSTLSTSIPKIGLDKAFKDMKSHKLYDEKFNVELQFSELEHTPARTKSTIITSTETNNNNDVTTTTIHTKTTTSENSQTSISTASSSTSSTDPVLNGPTTSTVEVTSVVVTTKADDAAAPHANGIDHAKDEPAHSDKPAHDEPAKEEPASVKEEPTPVKEEHAPAKEESAPEEPAPVQAEPAQESSEPAKEASEPAKEASEPAKEAEPASETTN